MTKRLSLISGLSLLLIGALFMGCDPNKGGGGGGGGAASGGGPSAGSGGAGTSSSPSDSGKPAEIAGAPHYKIITNGISPFWDSMILGMYKADTDLKVNGTWQAPQLDNNSEQVNLIQQALANKTDGIAISVIEADALSSTINEAAKHVPVITFDSDSGHSDRICYIGTNNFEAGRAAGLAALKLFPNGGKLVAFVGNMSAQNARDRYAGFNKALEGSKVSFLREPYVDEKDNTSARKNVEDAITKYGDQVNGFVGLYSYNGPAIINAVNAAKIRSRTKVICFDGEPDTLKGLTTGDVDLTVVQKPYEFGRLSIMMLDQLHKDRSFEKAVTALKPELDKLGMRVDMQNRSIDTGVEVITPANAKEFLDRLKSMNLKST